MTDTSAVIAVYADHTAAEAAVKELQKSGFDMKKLSVVGKDYHTDAGKSLATPTLKSTDLTDHVLEPAAPAVTR